MSSLPFDRSETYASLGIKDDEKLSISMNVMIEKLERIKRQKKALQILKQFKALDVDNSGMLDQDEFLQLASQVPEFDLLTPDQLLDEFKSIDVDGSGGINIAEFKEFYMESLKTAVNTNRPYPFMTLAELKKESRYKFLRRYMYILLFGGDTTKENEKLRLQFPEARYLGSFLALTVLLTVVSYALETLHGWEDWAGFLYIECVVCSIFAIEYFLRVWCVNRIAKWVFTFNGVIDLISWLPVWLIIIISTGLSNRDFSKLVASFRIVRVLRVLKISRFESLENYFEIFIDTIKLARYSFTMLLLVFAIGVYCWAAIGYAVERFYWIGCEQYTSSGTCEAASNLICNWTQQGGRCTTTFRDIFHASYWAIITQTAVGYGDIYPTSNLGLSVSIFTVIFGVLIFTFTINIIGSCFDEAFTRFLEREYNKLVLKLGDAVKAGNRGRQSVELVQVPSVPGSVKSEALKNVWHNKEAEDYILYNRQALLEFVTNLNGFFVSCGNERNIKTFTPHILYEVDRLHSEFSSFVSNVL